MTDLTPTTRKEHWLARIAGEDDLVLEPQTREEHFYQKIIDSGGGGGGGEVTPASVAYAISHMSDEQAAQALADLGYTVDAGLNENSVNPVQNSIVTGMFSLAQLALNQKANKETVVNVSGTTVDITPEPDREYECGELVSLTISDPPPSGKYSIIFFSGATATTIYGIQNFIPEANKRYQIDVKNNYAKYDSWPYTPT